jgi:hypothetical protein
MPWSAVKETISIAAVETGKGIFRDGEIDDNTTYVIIWSCFFKIIKITKDTELLGLSQSLELSNGPN